ncbi:cytochrome P450 [Nitzschia inconspicua]|uniref:Cytochrome P450 n=1 Tax=Nitzschia inconspicua TaxID=303405 RepID=A0A9K3LUF3_9STRA|nr:cytochrome P450 [Nitzschia inconspicua]
MSNSTVGLYQDCLSYVVSAILAYLIVSFFWKYQRVRETIKQLPPAPKYGFVEYLTQFLGSQGPQFALREARKIGYIYRFPGMPSVMRDLAWICVGEPNLGRMILEDPTSEKPWEVYQLFYKATSGDNFFTSNGKRANHVRKSTAAAFSGQNMKKIAITVEEVVDRWIEERLEPFYVKTGKSVDFDEEMMIVTTDVIARAAFDYQLPPTERTDFSLKMRTVMNVFFHQNLNLGKRLFGFMYADIREARRLALELKETFGKKLLQSYRDNPNPGPGNIAHLMLKDDDYDNDDQRARDVLLYFFAGFDTTAHTIAWAMLELAKSPKEQLHLRKSLEDFNKVGGNGQSVDMAVCPEVKLVAREVLRLHPAGALGSTRLIPKDFLVHNPDNKNEIGFFPKVAPAVSCHTLFFETTMFLVTTSTSLFQVVGSLQRRKC